jgi:hypothetical protein
MGRRNQSTWKAQSSNLEGAIKQLGRRNQATWKAQSINLEGTINQLGRHNQATQPLAMNNKYLPILILTKPKTFIK